jgi:hypothetical protein
MQLIALIVLAGALAVASTASAGDTSSTATRCGKWAVPARIAGKPVCLKDNQRCNERRAAQYRRYGFDCHGGFLITRWDFLRNRPLTELRIEPGQQCPVTTETGRVAGFSALGPGPAFPFGTHNVVTFTMPPEEGLGPEWGGVKRVWLLDTRHAGRALVRGRQLDGPNEVRFVRGPQWTPTKMLNPVRELQVEGPTPSMTRLRAPGCYAYQVDVRTSSYVVVFEARLHTG